MKLLKVEDRKVYNSVRGLICIGSRFEVEIYNPSTSQQYIFPQISIAVLWYWEEMEFGERFHGLAIFTMLRPRGYVSTEPFYYGAIRTYNKFSIVVSFDVRLETFNIIKGPVFEKLNNESKSDFRDKTVTPRPSLPVGPTSSLGAMGPPLSDGRSATIVIGDLRLQIAELFWKSASEQGKLFNNGSKAFVISRCVVESSKSIFDIDKLLLSITASPVPTTLRLRPHKRRRGFSPC
ncbi:F-box associated domain type 3 [Arabidopsis suecica]|uniref:F-box associated domain type 3 n=1 Tax=Arabidopsis suecica TaxID=45249 RepID=A0A8T2AIJ8_ARASU|nr:F-box associated domain type 3 [Arabidopsis suecica]